MSYTILLSAWVVRPAEKQDLVVSFRELEAHLDQGVNQLAQNTHGKLVPETSRNGIVDGADPPLTIYTMP